MQAPVSRNAPCPCGSGRRYKDCHGALAPAATGSPDPLQALLASALAAQQAGRTAEAIERYEAALARSPAHFDALHMLGVAHFQRGEFERAALRIDAALAIDGTNASARYNRRLVQEAIERRVAARELAGDAAAFASGIDAALPAVPVDAATRVIAFYLPQYHRIPENDAWWGEGFTEWTNVRRARPAFEGHAQPHEPGEVGSYDLTDPAVRRAQADLARAHGVDAFCYYWYWFGGRRLLERPLAEVLATGEPDFPFCVCWANENWTRRWDGLEHEVLMAQRYAPEDARAVIDELIPLFRDRRYLRVDGRPLLLVYKVADIPDPARMVEVWRRACRDAGVGDPYLCAVQRNSVDDPTPYGFDAAVEFPPIGHASENETGRTRFTRPFRGMVFDYRNLAAHYLMLPRPAFRLFSGVTPMWDNTARRPDEGMIIANASPEAFGAWTAHALRRTRLRHAGEERLLFVNAWNEWAEGNHLEPDARHGRRYLEALRAARGVEAERPPARPRFADIEREALALARDGALALSRFGERPSRDPDGVSVVMPLYDHARYVGRALASLAAQTRLPSEVVVVDDGSSDDGAAIVEAFAREAPFPVTLARQRNAGADRAINRGMALARGGRIALLNSDDRYAPDRLARLAAALDGGVSLAFSGVEPIGDDDAPVDGPYARALVERLAHAADDEALLRALAGHNVAVSTGNLVFRRALLDTVGGFAPLAVCHDWDFVLAASYATRFAVVPAPLYGYRLHDANTFAGRRLAGRLEGERVLDGFFLAIERHPWLDGGRLDAFLEYARSVGLGGYLPGGPYRREAR